MAASRRRFYAVVACIGAVLGLGLLNPGTALAYHNAYTSLYVSTAGVPYESVLFGNHAGTNFYVSPGSTSCCYVQPDAYVPAGRDLLFFSKEYPNWSYRAAATGWTPVPRLTSPQHITVRQVDH